MEVRSDEWWKEKQDNKAWLEIQLEVVPASTLFSIFFLKGLLITHAYTLIFTGLINGGVSYAAAVHWNRGVFPGSLIHTPLPH